jgi:S1-C subfamily serine protease
MNQQRRTPPSAADSGEPDGEHTEERGLSTVTEPPRLAPRPLQRPTVDRAQSAVFSRPRGITGSFDPEQRAVPQPDSGISRVPPQPEELTHAFSRPPGSDESLQRAPGEQPRGSEADEESAFWSEAGERDPWRNPASSSVLGPPALGEEITSTPQALTPGPLLSVREVLFGQRVRPQALLALGAVAVLIGGVGGFLGRWTFDAGNPLTNPRVTLAPVEPGSPRPAGTVASVAARVMPAVVSVEVTAGTQGSTGSGVVIDGNGYILTNNHVISAAADTPGSQIWVVFDGGSRAPGRIVGRDTKTDLAVLKTSVTNPTVAQFGRSSTLAVGDPVIAIGSPLGLADTVTSGIVSSVHRPVSLSGDGSDTSAVIDAIQTDAAVNPGNSGGPLVDTNGAVIGINSAIRTLGAGGQGGSIGLGFAIPIDEARGIAQQLIRTGRVQHANLGVNTRSVTNGAQVGAQVQNVQDGSAAAEAGLDDGDVIVQVGNRKITNSDDLIVAVDEHGIGQMVPVTVVRQGRPLVLNVTLR